MKSGFEIADDGTVILRPNAPRMWDSYGDEIRMSPQFVRQMEEASHRWSMDQGHKTSMAMKAGKFPTKAKGVRVVDPDGVERGWSVPMTEEAE